MKDVKQAKKDFNGILDDIEKASPALRDLVWDALAKQYGGYDGILNHVMADGTTEQLKNELNSIARDIVYNDKDTEDSRKVELYGKLPVGKPKGRDWQTEIIGQELPEGRKVEPGKGLSHNDKVYLASKWKVGLNDVDTILKDSRKDFVKKSQEGLDQKNVDKKAYYGAITSGDDDTANAIAKNYENDPEFQAWKEGVDQDKLGKIGKVGHFIAETAAPSVMHKLDNSVSTGEDVKIYDPYNLTGDLVTAGLADVGSNLLLGSAGKMVKAAGAPVVKRLKWVGKNGSELLSKIPTKELSKWAGKWPGKVINNTEETLKGLSGWRGATTPYGLLGTKAAELAGNAVLGTLTEAGRQYLSGEDVNRASAAITGASQGAANAAIDTGMGYLLGLKIPGISQLARRIKRSNRQDNDFNWKWNAAERAENIDKVIRNGGNDLFVMTKKEGLESNPALVMTKNMTDFVKKDLKDKQASLKSLKRGWKNVMAMPEGPEKEAALKLQEEIMIPKKKELAWTIPEGKGRMKALNKSANGYATQDLKAKSDELKKAILKDPDELIVEWAKGETKGYPELTSRASSLANDWTAVNKRNKKGQFQKPPFELAYPDIISTRLVANQIEEDPYKLQRWANGYATSEEKKTP